MGISGALLTDLSKDSDCLLHDLLIAKLTASGFDYDSLVVIQSYLSERQQRTKVNNEIFKVKKSLAPEIMAEVFEIKEPHYNLRSEASHFKRENIKSANCGMQSVRYSGSKIWNILPKNIKECNSLKEFKSLIKFWQPDTCLCRLCKNCITHVGFI